MLSTNEIRAQFLQFFRSNEHEVVPSSSLVPNNDPSLLFTNAGMVQFKNVFTGIERRQYSRAVTSQKCVRAGGKHNDLDNVGYTARHHTFFEMLGNFSFGDYFKDVAIEFAWKLITEEFGLSKDRLLVTVYAEDHEAASLWQQISGLREERIIRIATADNFWSMGDLGPCGPCSEIFYDHGPGIPGGPPGSPDEDGDRFIEIWNLVFMQFEQIADDVREPLPRPSIDTGMGLERIAAVLQGVHDNYQIDLFQRLIQTSAELTKTSANDSHASSHKVIADHIRSCSFLLADGVTPSNEGRGYVLRRIMRRAMRHAHILGAKEPLLWRLVPVLVDEMGSAFPELARARANIQEWLQLEEANFIRTLDRGLALLEEEISALPASSSLPGETAFRLYDTYGFPLDLTQDALRSYGREVDLEGFDKAMERQRQAARQNWKGSGADGIDPIWFELRELHGPTEFLGYDSTVTEAILSAIVSEGATVTLAGSGSDCTLVTNQTPFYAESGGQVGDTGTIVGPDFELEVIDTRKVVGDLWLHFCTVRKGTARVDTTVSMSVDANRRLSLRRAHSATHLLHQALRRHLGNHVAQRGSLVAPDRLRFDFSHKQPLSNDELQTIEREVNLYARQNDEVTIRHMARDEAIEGGAIALFGEKYGDEVRVVTMGHRENGEAYSTELCGGTHAARTGDIAIIKLINESAVASGIRRIEAVTGEIALKTIEETEEALQGAALLLKVQPEHVAERIDTLLNERRRLEREITDLRRQAATGGLDQTAAIINYGDISFVSRSLQGVPAKELRGTADTIRKELRSGVVALVSEFDGKAAVIVSVTEDLTNRLNAVELVKQGVSILGGKGGGGRPDFAQGGGPDPSRATEALDAIEAGIAKITTR